MTAAQPQSSWRVALHVLLVLQLLLAGICQLVFAVCDLLFFAASFPSAVAVLFWLIGGVFSLAAARGHAKGTKWSLSALLAAEVTIALGAVYVLWVDVQSAYADWALRVFASAFLAVAVWVFLALGSRLRGLLSKTGAVGLALLSALGVAPFFLENYVVPARTPPVLELSASLEEVGRSGGVAHVRGAITWKDSGHAKLWLPHAYAWVEENDVTGDGVAELEPADVLPTLDPLSVDRRAFQRVLPEGAAGGVVWLEDLEPYFATMEPGESWRQEFLIDVDPRVVPHLALHAYLTAFSASSFETPQTCGSRVDALQRGFLPDFQTGLEVDRYRFSCLYVPVRARNTVRFLADDRPAVVSGFYLRAPSRRELGPYVYVASDEEDPADTAAIAAATERQNRRMPNSSVVTVAVLAVPLEPPDDASRSSPPK